MKIIKFNIHRVPKLFLYFIRNLLNLRVQINFLADKSFQYPLCLQLIILILIPNNLITLP